MGETEQGKGKGEGGGMRFEEKGRDGGGKAAISVIRRPALARH